MSRQTVISKNEFLRLYGEGKNDHEIAAILNVSHDCVYRIRRKLLKSDMIPQRTHIALESKVIHETKATGNVLSACSEVEVMLKNKDESYVKGFEDGARWRLNLSKAKTNGRTQ